MNYHVPQKNIGHITPIQALKDWHKKQPELFKKKIYDLSGLDVHSRGSRFYIDDSDLESKSTFSLPGQLFALQSGQLKSTAPVLTLPVGN